MAVEAGDAATKNTKAGKDAAKSELNRIRDQHMASEDDDDDSDAENKPNKNQDNNTAIGDEDESDLVSLDQFKCLFRSLKMKFDPEGRVD